MHVFIQTTVYVLGWVNLFRFVYSLKKSIQGLKGQNTASHLLAGVADELQQVDD